MTVPIQRKGPLLRLADGALRERRYRLEVVEGPDRGAHVPLEGTLLVGTWEEAGLRLTDPTVSRRHLELVARGDGVRVRDLESRNGTMLGSARIQEAIVGEDTALQLGNTRLRLSVEEADVPVGLGAERFGAVLGQSAAMRRVTGLLERVAPTDSTVLLLGETGTGKGLLAEAIHKASARKQRRFVVFDCAAVAPTLVESQLFGHIKGAFTGAVSDRDGALLEADGGTLFLDEIGELPAELQPRLLRALESGVIRRLGESKDRSVDVRIIAATHRDLHAEVEAGRFRMDLYFRLAVILVRVPALRERREDIPKLARHFLEELGRSDLPFSETLWTRFGQYDWPGNVRELRNVVERTVAGDDPLADTASPGTHLPFKVAKEQLVDVFTREYFTALFHRCGGNVSRTAAEAGLARTYVSKLVAKYGLRPTDEG